MYDDLSGREQRERDAYPPEGPAADQRRASPPRRVRRQPRRIRLSVISLALSAAALVLAVAALVVALRGSGKTEDAPASDIPKDEEVTFQFGGRTLTPVEGMPLNLYDRNAFARDGKGRVTYAANGRQAKTGIDVSSHQEEVDWQAVKADGIDFVMLRLGRRGYTEGGLFPDDNFEQNLQGALDAGLEVGAYFFSQAVTVREAEEEAEYVLEALGGRELTFPVAFDWESIPGEEARTDGVDGGEMTRCAAAFCKRIADGGYRPAVYFNQTQGYLRYDLRDLAEYELWLAEYGDAPDFYYHFDLWQYSQSGQVDGIQGSVDLNLAF